MKNLIAKRRFAFLYLSALLVVTSSCKKEGVTLADQPPHAIKLEVPTNFPRFTDDPDNPLTEEGIELGRILFYDTRLSGNNQLSCASCHQQKLAFSDGVSLNNIGVSGVKLPRHSPALINLAWVTNGLFWDGGSTNLESQAFAPITNSDEMQQNLTELEVELKQVPDYVKRFKQAFNSEIKSANIVKALAQFQKTLVSGNSKYDQYIRKESGIKFSPQELNGLVLVQTKCRSCHAGELFTDNSYHNNGMDNDFSNTDHELLYQGRSRVTFNPLDLGKFKTPTLRNVMLTAPYMHDGRFKTIYEVLAHYHTGIKDGPTTDILLRQANGKTGIPLSTIEKGDIIAFLNTLTDNTFITNKKISNPN